MNTDIVTNLSIFQFRQLFAFKSDPVLCEDCLKAAVVDKRI